MNTNSALRLAVFDCDGTLSDGQAAVCTAMEWAFADAGLPPPDRSEVRRTVGLSLPQAIATLAPNLSPEMQVLTVEAYKLAFRRARSEGTLHEPLYEGIADLIKRMDATGWILGVATGKSSRGLRLTLAAHDLSAHFTTLQTADLHPSKPDPSMLMAAMVDAGTDVASTVMIGDTVYDIAMARSIGVRALGVNWGYHSPEELLTAGAEAVAQSVDELGELLGV